MRERERVEREGGERGRERGRDRERKLSERELGNVLLVVYLIFRP